MAGIKKQIETGKFLLKEFRRLDKEVTDQYLTQSKDTHDILIHEIKFFGQKAEKFIDSSEAFVNSTEIHLVSSQHEYMNDYEVDSPALRDFYSYGITIEQIVKELEALAKGISKVERIYDNKFHYIVDEKIVYRSHCELRIHSKDFKREAICEVVFENAPDWVPAVEIGDRQEEKCGYADDGIGGNPYKWIRPACNALNKKIRYQFEVEFDLFEKGENQVRLNPKAM